MAFQGYEKVRSWRSASFLLKGLAAVSVLLFCGYGISSVDRHPAATLAKKMGKPEQLLMGLGSADAAGIKTKKIGVDILDQYLVGVGESSWASWNLPRGEYIRVFTEQADAVGAVPMFTLYQMGDIPNANLSGLTDRNFMAQYWANVKLLFLKLGQYDSPALVNLEPDFWGHAQKQALNDDPGTMKAQVSINPDCANLPDTVTGIAACQMRVARRYAPKALLGFPVSDWGGRSSIEVAQFMKKLGADKADFVVLPAQKQSVVGIETSAQAVKSAFVSAYSSSVEVSGRSQKFDIPLDKVRFYHEAMGDLPVLLWRASFDLSSANPSEASAKKTGDSARNFMDNADKLVAAGGVGIVFNVGESRRSDTDNDEEQFIFISLRHYASPAPL